MTNQGLSLDDKVAELFEKLAGDKRYKVTARALELRTAGKSLHRAWADALEEFKLLPSTTVDED